MFSFLSIFSAIVTKMRDCLRCQKRSLLIQEAKNKTKRLPKVQNLAERDKYEPDSGKENVGFKKL